MVRNTMTERNITGKRKYTFRWCMAAFLIVLVAVFGVAGHFPVQAEGLQDVVGVEVTTGDEDAADDDEAEFAIEAEDTEYDYVITGYDINVVVNENNTLDITERITADFRTPKHGIYRNIPLRNKVKRQDGTESSNRTRVTGLSVDAPYETETEDNMLKIRIGDTGRTVTGPNTYVIKYNYNLGKDPSDQYDELYFNLIGTEWSRPISGVSFTIKMPKEFDTSKLGFSYGRYGTVNTEAVHFTMEGLTAKGTLDTVLNPGEGLTVRCELPEGYFVGAGLSNRTLEYICYSIPVLFLLISILIWRKYGKDDVVVETVEFYPPNGVNSLEAGFLYKGQTDSVDVVSLLIYLANQGYISIEEIETKKLIGKKKGFQVVEQRPYDGNDPNERTFLQGLFACGRDRDGVCVVTSDDLSETFYTTKNKIIQNMSKKEHTEQVFVKQSFWRWALLFLMIVGSFLLMCLPPIIAFEDPSTLWVMLFPLIGFGCIVGSFLGGRGKGRRRKGSGGSKMFMVVFGLFFGGVPLAGFMLPLLSEDPIYIIGFCVDFICCFGIVLCFIYLPKRTPYGNEMLGRLSGFKNFLEVAEKEQLEQMVMQDPMYFFNILPYTYVLGVSDKWIKKFETIVTTPPSWYSSSYYDPYTFSTFMDNTMTTATRSMTSTPSESSGGGGGGFSGGGFSGGGSGGGGGGAW